MRKIMVGLGCMVMGLAMTTLSFGIQLSPEAATAVKGSLNGTYVKEVKGDKISYSSACTAFSAEELDTILKAYGLSKEAKMSTVPTAYTPSEYDEIFTSYGLQLDPGCIQSTIGKIKYAVKVSSDGKVTLGDRPTAYTGEELAEILACYNLSAKPMMTKMTSTNEEHWVMPSDTLFDFDKAVIKKQYYKNLDGVAADINKDQSIKVEVQGHTDSIGSEKYNMGLSKRRANAVRNYLIKKGGVAPDRLTAVGYGESMPIASNKTKEGRAKNRRVELKIIK